MLAGVLAGFLSFCFASLVTEPLIEQAIALESGATVEAHHSHSGAASAELVAHAPAHVHGTEIDRHTQSGAGLLTGLVVLGAAVGGLFALVYAFCMGRVGPADTRQLTVRIAAAGFVSLVLIPALKYPANPPGVGSADTIGFRTTLFFSLIVLSILVMTATVQLCRKLAQRSDAFNAGAISAIVYLAVMTTLLVALPSYDEAPHDYPASLLWHYRLASIGTQGMLWLSLGLAFAISAYRLNTQRVQLLSLKAT
jgi:predicted cobalt transporter CbtA